MKLFERNREGETIYILEGQKSLPMNEKELIETYNLIQPILQVKGLVCPYRTPVNEVV